MPNGEKPQPSAPLPQMSLAERVSRAIQDEEIRRPLSIRMTVRGGLPSQRYAFEFAASGDGAAHCRLDDQLRNRKADSEGQRRALSSRDFVSLLRRVRPALEQPAEPPSFLPDTVVGVLEVSDGTTVHRIYFAADPEQAKTQGKVPPREVQQAVDAVFAAGATMTGLRQVKP